MAIAGLNTKETASFLKMLGSSLEKSIDNRKAAMVEILDPIQQRKVMIHQLDLGNTPVRRFFGESDNDDSTMRRIIGTFTNEINKAVNKI